MAARAHPGEQRSAQRVFRSRHPLPTGRGRGNGAARRAPRCAVAGRPCRRPAAPRRDRRNGQCPRAHGDHLADRPGEPHHRGVARRRTHCRAPAFDRLRGRHKRGRVAGGHRAVVAPRRHRRDRPDRGGGPPRGLQHLPPGDGHLGVRRGAQPLPGRHPAAAPHAGGSGPHRGGAAAVPVRRRPRPLRAGRGGRAQRGQSAGGRAVGAAALAAPRTGRHPGSQRQGPLHRAVYLRDRHRVPRTLGG